jgi:hypothetical protein
VLTIENDQVRIELDEHWPRATRLVRKATGGALPGCEPDRPFAVELNRQPVGQPDMACTVEIDETSADYVVRVPGLDLLLRFRFTLEDSDLVLTLPEVSEGGRFSLERLYIPQHRLVTGTAANGDRYLRHVLRRTNWSRHWCPGTEYYDQWEDMGGVGDAQPEYGPRRCLYACVWNRKICVGVVGSSYVDPLVTALDEEGSVRDGRAGRFAIWAGPHCHRLRGELAEPFQLRMGVLDDYNGNGKIDWCDAAAWEQDRLPESNPLYREAAVYKIYCDDRRRAFPLHTFADCLEVIRTVHQVSGGLRQIVYLVGWQDVGHDSGYPCHAVVNKRLGGREALVQLIEIARAYNCTVTLHANVDDSYEANPEFRRDLLSRDADGEPFVWFNNPELGGGPCYSINHTLSVESGYERDRCDRLCEMLPLRESIHFDAFRSCGEVWEPDGVHIDAECEVQRGMIPIIRMYAEKGVDVTAEGGMEEGRALFSWVWLLPGWQHHYHTVVTHGRVLGHWRTSGRENPGQPEKQALGESVVYPERGADYATVVKCFYLDWMYSQILSRKRMLDYWTGDWNRGVRAWYEDDTRTVGGLPPHDVQAWYEGIPVARGTDRFLPWRENVIFAYSEEGGEMEWTLPEPWEGARITARELRRNSAAEEIGFTVQGRTVRFRAPAGVPIKFVNEPLRDQ